MNRESGLIRTYREGDLGQTVRLVREAFPPSYGIKDVSWWQWKHFKNPLGPSVMVVAECKGRVVGMHSMLRWPMWHQNRQVLAFQGAGAAVHPDYRRRGFFAHMSREALNICRRESGSFAFAHPTAMGLPGLLKLGWQQGPPLRWLFMPVRLTATIRRISNLLLHPMQGTTCPALKGGTDIRVLLHDDAKVVERFIERRRTHASSWLSTSRSVEFYRWRYAEHPHNAYVCVTERQGDQITALVMTRMLMPGAYVCAMLTDFLALSLQDGLSALRNLISFASESGVDLLLAIRPPASVTEHQALRRVGFRAIPRRHTAFVTAPLEGRYPGLERGLFHTVAGDIIAT